MTPVRVKIIMLEAGSKAKGTTTKRGRRSTVSLDIGQSKIEVFWSF